MAARYNAMLLVLIVLPLFLTSVIAEVQGKPDASSGLGKEDQTAVPEKAEWKTVEVKDQQVEMRVPAGSNWQTRRPNGSTGRTPAFCGGPRRGRSRLLLTARHNKYNAGISLARVEEEFVLKNREDLRAYIDKRLKNMKQSEENDITIHTSQLEERNGHVVYRLSFSGPLGGHRGGGCAGASREKQETQGRFQIVEHYLRTPETKNARVYRIGAVASENAGDTLNANIRKASASFTFTGETSGNLFVPEVSSSELPSPGKTNARGVSNGPWLFIGLIIVTIVVMWHINKRYRSHSA